MHHNQDGVDEMTIETFIHSLNVSFTKAVISIYIFCIVQRNKVRCKPNTTKNLWPVANLARQFSHAMQIFLFIDYKRNQFLRKIIMIMH